MKSYAKINREKIRAHIIEHYEGRASDDGMTPLELLRDEFDAVNYGNVSPQEAAKRLAEGGNFLVYTGDMRDFIEDLSLDDTRKEYDDADVFNKYCNLIAREVAHLVKAARNE